ncbi:NfrA family protein [Castellaniella sp.]|uniref:NfrA family protein n=1 Tax=Castellaniella sp. TaxID=1955812 RepID=UPI002AFE6582|nr:tetratricopeptide repeat protein [Castellaniella sp.]
MKPAIHLHTVDIPAVRREKTIPLRRLASGLVLAASVSVLTLIAVEPSRAQPIAEARTAEGADQPVPPGLTGVAWNLANQAYTAYELKDYRRTIELARKALILRPDVPQLWLLLMDALEADGRMVDAVAAGQEAVAAGTKDQALLARLRSQSRVLAQAPSLAANKALLARDPKTAVTEVKKAIALVPDDLSYRVLLVYALIADHQIGAAEKAATEAIGVDSSTFLPKVLRGYLRERMGNIAEANIDFDAALKDEVLSGETERDVRIIIADAALAAGEPARAIAILEPLGQTNDLRVAIRQEAAQAQLRDPALAESKSYEQLPVPFQKCTDTPYGPVCTLVPASTPPGRGITDTPGFVTAQGAFAAYRADNDKLAEELIREALKINPGMASWHRLLFSVLERANKPEALDAAIKEATPLIGDDAALQALRASNKKKMAEPFAVDAIQALSDGRAKKAVEFAQQAVARSPETMTFHIVLIHALIASGDHIGALNASNAAVKEDGNDPLARVLQAWLLAKENKSVESEQAFKALLASDILTDSEELNYRLIAANASLSRGDAAFALEVLKPLDVARAPDVAAYRAIAGRMEQSSAVKRPALAAPSVLCQPTNYGVICSVFFGAAGVWTGGSGQGETVAQQPGYEAANAAYQALSGKNYARAITLARQALNEAPGNTNYRQLLLSALIGAGRYGEAENIVSQLLTTNPRDVILLVQRGNLRLQAGQYAGAISDYQKALNSRGLSGPQARNIRLSLADAALQAKDPELAVTTLKPLASEASYAVQSRLGYAWVLLDDKVQALAAFELAASSASSKRERNAMLTARINLLSQLGRKNEARALFVVATEQGDLRGLDTVELAVLASSAGEDDMAFDLFSKAGDQWQLRGNNLITAAYNARRTYHNEKAVDYLKNAIDEHRAGKLNISPQYAFGLRREVAELTRTWGAYMSASYGAAGIAPNSYLVGPTNMRGRHTMALGGEIYWRPPLIGYRDGSLFEVFARGFSTAYDEDGGPTGADTFQPSIGARWKPLREHNLVLEASYLFPVSKYSREDWLLRVAYSNGEGTDLRVDVPNWLAWQIYGDFNYYVTQPQTVASFEFRYGHAFRMNPISDRLVFWPFLAFGGSYDTGYDTPLALGIGPGITARYWFREDEYTAPQSYVDLTAQYRFKLAGDERAEGLFAGAFLSY